ncbi:MAG: hypothetical protein EOO14_02565 [Chitinophagaceae bacterium]|nr:MAG: hypothetical protein EOO14_02565 [Chitinophagaceae bacterium]
MDSQLLAGFKSFHRLQHPAIDSVTRYGTTYFYSWQKAAPGYGAFTAFVNAGDHGHKILFFVFTRSGRLCSATAVASKSGEGGILYETRSRYITNDTLQKISAATSQ